jgi:murein DD-endopeptidase MepM/ murein hydrolase activator NlpD
MQEAAFWSRLGRGALGIIATGLLFGVGGCSSGVSRFDYPAFHLTSSSPTGSQGTPSASYAADPATTASLPVPEESVYSPGAAETYSPSSGSGASYARNDLPPPPTPAYAPAHTYTPRVTPASYSPAQRPYVQPRKVSYSAPAPLRAEPAVVRAETPASSPTTVKVEQGDSLGSIAKRNGVSIEALKAANNLTDTRLNAGQELIIPTPGSPVEVKASAAPKTYKVEKRDTPHLIAEKLGVKEKDLIARNKLHAEKLRIGQVLIVPGAGSGSDTSPADAASASDSKPASAAPEVHVVHTTTIPAPGAAGVDHPSAAVTVDAPSAAQAHTTSPTAASPEVTGGASAKSNTTPDSQVASVDQLPTPDPMSGNSFRWPVQGRIISVFGTKPDGGHNDGIDVAVPQGTSVKAAENGVVAYAGNELKGYGNLVLVRHANNWVSAYAHNEEILVKRGDKVRRGQIIAKAGNTGSVSQPQVHFELRKGSRPVDPTKYMSQTQANAD